MIFMAASWGQIDTNNSAFLGPLPWWHFAVLTPRFTRENKILIITFAYNIFNHKVFTVKCKVKP